MDGFLTVVEEHWANAVCPYCRESKLVSFRHTDIDLDVQCWPCGEHFVLKASKLRAAARAGDISPDIIGSR